MYCNARKGRTDYSDKRLDRSELAQQKFPKPV
jgi:hypothetical protein